MAKVQTNVENLKLNRGTYAKIQENINQIPDGEYIELTDKNVPIPTSNDNGKFLGISNGDYALLTIDLSSYATQTWIQQQGFLTSASLSGYATESYVSTNYQLKITSSNKLNADYIQDGSTNKAFTSTDQTNIDNNKRAITKCGRAFEIDPNAEGIKLGQSQYGNYYKYYDENGNQLTNSEVQSYYDDYVCGNSLFATQDSIVNMYDEDTEVDTYLIIWINAITAFIIYPYEKLPIGIIVSAGEDYPIRYYCGGYSTQFRAVVSKDYVDDIVGDIETLLGAL